MKDVQLPRKTRRPRKDIELFAHGITLGSRQRRPVLILKDKSGETSLAVWLNPIDASHALQDFAYQASASHTVTEKLLERVKYKLERCVFAEIQGHHQYVDLYFSGEPKFHLRVRADVAMSLCLALGARFFASPEFIAQCREVDAEMMNIESSLKMKPEIGSKNHRYVM